MLYEGMLVGLGFSTGIINVIRGLKANEVGACRGFHTRQIEESFFLFGRFSSSGHYCLEVQKKNFHFLFMPVWIGPGESGAATYDPL